MIEILNDNLEEIKEFNKYGWGGSEHELSVEQVLQLLKGGKALAIFDGEYTHIIRIVKEVTKCLNQE